jgi:hypothetical protein
MDLVIAVLIIIAVQLVMFLILRGRIHQELNATTLLKDVQDEVDGMVRELNLSAERNIGLLEARIDELEGLLGQADQKIVLLNREVERREKTAEVYTQLKRVVPEPSAPEPELFELPPSKPSAPAAVAAPATVAVPAAEPARPRTLKERVLDLRDQGLDAGAIASSTGATRGEVELILSLNPKG